MSSREAAVFSPRLVIALVVAAVIALGGFALLSTYGPSIAAGRDGGPHALSRSAVGFAGLVRLLEEAGWNSYLVRDSGDWKTEELLIVPLVPGQDQARLAELIEMRRALPTLLVLPKWRATPRPTRPGWVEQRGLLLPGDIELLGREVPDLKGLVVAQRPQPAGARLVATDLPAGLAMPVPAQVQTAEIPGATPLLATPDGAAVLLQTGRGGLYVLADPDLLANHVLDDVATAWAAMRLLEDLNSTGAEGFAFDLVVAGLGRERSLFRLAFEPPFVALTLALLGAALLAAVQAAVRFGRPVPEPRAIPFGSRALVENAAGLLRRAGRDHRVGAAYAALARDRAAAAVAAPPQLGGEALEAYLDGLGHAGSPRFTELAAALAGADSREALLAAAVRIDRWLDELTRGAGPARRSRDVA